MSLVNIKIEGKDYQVDSSLTVLEACRNLLHLNLVAFRQLISFVDKAMICCNQISCI